ncbi:MAG TPA: PadR family transcriptional regulator [Dictyobacter sp.]|nr:PadR family transcriptional regulator [Dictyobacter sp.]
MFRGRHFAFQFQGGPGDWEGWTPPWLQGDREDFHQRARMFKMRMRRGFFGPNGPFGPENPFQHHGPGGHHGHGPGHRFFGRGDVKFALLKLLQERPMHGYEMMKALEERSGGFYAPSAGTIYPTLQMLEDRELVTVQEVEGKKVYSITDAGKAALEERQQEEEANFTNTPWGRAFQEGRRWNAPEIQALRSEAMEVARLFAIAGRSSFQNPEKLTQLRAILERSRKELTDLIYGNNEATSSTTDTPPTPDQQ